MINPIQESGCPFISPELIKPTPLSGFVD